MKLVGKVYRGGVTGAIYTNFDNAEDIGTKPIDLYMLEPGEDLDATRKERDTAQRQVKVLVEYIARIAVKNVAGPNIDAELAQARRYIEEQGL